MEWLDLLKATSLGLANESLEGFLNLCRCLLIKREEDLDRFDQCFAAFFHDGEAPPKITDDLLEWLKDAKLPRQLSEDELARLKALEFEELERQFEERLREQKERHDGGNRWVGTGGTSPFGHSGTNPMGIRVGGESSLRQAVKLAAARRFRNLRSDVVLDTRQFSLALKALRHLARDDFARSELDLDQSINQTAKNLGDIELIYRPSRVNNARLLLLLDTGGSMTAYSRLSEQLFSAASSLHHFKEFRAFTFHNCIYDDLREASGECREVATTEVLRSVCEDWYVMIVGDALMSPFELTHSGGRIDYGTYNEEPGLIWLKKIRQRLPKSVWLNPERREAWEMPSARLIRQVFPQMFPLTLEGVSEAVHVLKKAKN